MKKAKILSAALCSILAASVISGCGAKTENNTADLIESASSLETTAVAEKEIKPAPSDRDMGVVPRLIVRANADETVVSRFYGATVSDVILTIGIKDPTPVINELKAAGISVWLSVNAVNADDNALAIVETLLGKYSFDGIELDFMGLGAAEAYASDTYGRIDTVDAFVATVSAKAAEAGKKTAVRVAGDIMTSYNLGLDVAAWVADGCVSMISPSSASKVTDTTMPIRLWYSIFEPYDVILAPTMGADIKAYSDVAAKPQIAATLAGEAAMLLSMGADKVCVDYAVADDASLKTLGSYNTLMATDRRAVLTYTDFKAGWQADNEQLPKSLSMGGSTVIRIPVGEVTEGSVLTLRLGAYPILPNPLKSLTVYANSELCTPAVSAPCEGGYTNTELYGFTIPTSVVDEGHIVAEITCTNGLFTINYAEVYVDAK